MQKLLYMKKGNQKIAKVCGVFDLPTSVCGKSCKSCYSKKAEVQYPNTRAFRQRCLDLANSDEFIDTLDKEIKASGVPYYRIHASGDFYSLEYITKWSELIKRNKGIKFYAWTKSELDLSELNKHKNMNLMYSLTDDGNLNYGTKEYCNDLVSKGYFLCPDQGSHNVCFYSCTACLTKKKVCFIQH